MSTQKLNPSTDTNWMAASETNVQFTNIKGIFPQGDGQVTFTDDSGASKTTEVLKCQTPDCVAGDVLISSTTVDLIIL